MILFHVPDPALAYTVSDSYNCRVTPKEKITHLTEQDTEGQRDYETKSRYAAAAAKSLQSCPTLCDPIDGSPPGSPVPGILQARTLEWVAISVSNA